MKRMKNPNRRQCHDALSRLTDCELRQFVRHPKGRDINFVCMAYGILCERRGQR